MGYTHHIEVSDYGRTIYTTPHLICRIEEGQAHGLLGAQFGFGTNEEEGS
jgi:hypothetical protein